MQHRPRPVSGSEASRRLNRAHSHARVPRPTSKSGGATAACSQPLSILKRCADACKSGTCWRRIAQATAHLAAAERQRTIAAAYRRKTSPQTLLSSAQQAVSKISTLLPQAPAQGEKNSTKKKKIAQLNEGFAGVVPNIPPRSQPRPRQDVVCTVHLYSKVLPRTRSE